jgi:hypothetical protein
MPLSVRLDRQTESAVRRLARRRNQTRSAVVREAIAAYESGHADDPEPATPWAVISHLVGAADSGGRRLSEDTGRGLRELLEKKTLARRPR